MVTSMPAARAARPKPAHTSGDVEVVCGAAVPVPGADGVDPLRVEPWMELPVAAEPVEPLTLLVFEMFDPEMFEAVFSTGVSPVITTAPVVLVGDGLAVSVGV